MKSKLISLVTAVLIAILLTSTVFAGSVRLSNVTFSIGTDTTGGSGGLAAMAALDSSSEVSSFPSLVAEGTLTGLGKQNVKVVLDASGLPDVTCTNQGGTQAPGQNPPKVSVTGEKLLSGDSQATKNGKSPFDVATFATQSLDPVVFGCPNENWSAQIDFIDWEKATIKIFDATGTVELLSQAYTCKTTRNPPTVTCKPE